MRYELFDYQETAKAVVVRSLLSMAKSYDSDPADLGAVVLAAPTGAGKTVIATAVIESALDGDDETPGIDTSTFLWVTDDPSLNNQTLHKMVGASSALSVNRLITIENDFDAETFEPGRVYFLNIQKLSATANLGKRATDGRRWSLWDTIANTVRERPYGFVVVIDEAHRGMGTARTTRDTIVSQIIGGGSTERSAVPVVWGISATPKRFRDQMNDRNRTVKSHTVPIEDVRASGLLKDQIVLGHTKGVEAAETTLLRHAVARVREYEIAWDAYCASNGDPQVAPILVVQVEDKPSGKDLGDLIATLLDEWPRLTPSNVVHVFGTRATEQAGPYEIRWCPPEDIQDRHDVRVVLCKTAITTGWDCPRAEVLVSMRVARDQDLITQIMGRMVRTPLARRVLTDQTLNSVHCILPKFDERAVDGIAAQFEQGDDGIAGGTEVIAEPVELSRNPSLSSAVPHASMPADTMVAGNAQVGDDVTVPDASWLGDDSAPAVRQNVESGTAVIARPSGGTPQQGPDLFDAAREPDPAQLTASGPADVFSVIESLTSYTIPRRTRRPAVARLTTLATLLAEKHDGYAIEPAAQQMARHALLAEVDTLRADLDVKGELDERVRQVAQTRLYERAVTYGSPTMSPMVDQTNIDLDARGIGILMGRARRALPEGLAEAYVAKLAPHDDDVIDAMILTIALAQDSGLPGRVESRAANLVADWLQRYQSQITRLSAAAQERFDRVRRESDRPLPTTLTIPSRRRSDGSAGDLWERHVLSDEEGLFRAQFGETEAHVLRTELSHGAVAWYRNPPNSRSHSLTIPWDAWDGIRGLNPDFLFVNRVDGRLRPSIIDPHGAYLTDAVGKLKGLAAYCDGHGHDFHRVQAVDLIDRRYRMLNLLDADVRAAVKAHNGPDASALYRDHGSDY